eukprot:Phypoly_transcript_07661.p1 GENE.Phypoly_transcript_07661~~Phypoly_transcript_07661.p1  ORF type:complete len:262 (+),score=36.25 Phypoly_transcript_07661:126-911(+)
MDSEPFFPSSSSSSTARMDLIEIVRKGWEDAAVPYRTTKDESLLHLPILDQFISLVVQCKGRIGDNNNENNKNDVVLELGCGCGYPLAEHIVKCLQKTPIKYHGVDLSKAQIQLARDEYPSLSTNFEVAEMLEYCSNLEDFSLCGVICLFALFHLPRTKHVELFSQIKRVLKKGAPFLFSLAANSYEGVVEDWLGAKMYWSNFSPAWYELTMNELGFELLTKFKEDKNFLGERESTWYMLFRIPDDNDVTFSFFGPQTTKT